MTALEIVIIVLVALALLTVAFLAVQHHRRAGGVVAVRPGPRRGRRGAHR